MQIYNLTNELKALFPLDTGEHKRVLDIMNHGGLPLLIHYFLKWNDESDDPFNFNPAAVYSILDHVIRRTFAFGKPLEAITVTEIVQGKITCGIAPALVKRRTIEENLSLLAQSGLLIKIRFKQSVTQRVLYGAHLYYLVGFPYHYWKQELEGERPKALAARRLYERMETVCTLLDKLKGDFDRLKGLKNPLPDFDSLLRPWRQ
jgi:hypothetical protein